MRSGLFIWQPNIVNDTQVFDELHISSVIKAISPDHNIRDHVVAFPLTFKTVLSSSVVWFSKNFTTWLPTITGKDF